MTFQVTGSRGLFRMFVIKKLRSTYLVAYEIFVRVGIKVSYRFPFLWPYWKLLNPAASKRVMSQFLEEIKDTKTCLTLVYDFKVVPPTIGDFSYVIVLLRFLIQHGHNVTLIVINSEFRKDWSSMTCEAIDGFTKEIENISLALLDKRSSQFRVESWSSKLLSELKPESVLFSKDVFSRSAFYHLLPNLLNDLLYQTDQEMLDKILFSKSEFPVVEKSLPADYVTLIVRSSNLWGEARNTKLEDLARTIHLVRQKISNVEIVVVSDQLTCNYFREEIQRLDLRCSFSKDYTSSFLGDVSVIFGGSHCFQLNAGGICVYPIFSYMPYLFVMGPGNYIPWARKSLTSFAKPNQQFYGTYKKEVFFDKICRL